jgi:hypothetical protein
MRTIEYSRTRWVGEGGGATSSVTFKRDLPKGLQGWEMYSLLSYMKSKCNKSALNLKYNFY